ncbi:nicotinamide mononucleotide adenylyltransferas-like protein [Patellaria atrata CBS 101060]|uniref:Nicotinamide-nucleotide adenylyltransferase n=1 Tax=Patellaria atrata CBS 101060 TaxID=1346257 RepID=A0A9P4VRK7_9PEZI|nr:nicotinamide mononucleotide adenylyltransferas-like protein [Patellaria atrata CBS 101060]
MQPGDTLEGYQFDQSKLQTTLKTNKKPLVLVSCGSFSPTTYLHLRMVELAADYCRLSQEWEFIGAYMSPVGAKYRKQGLAPVHHRVNMARLAVRNSPVLMVDDHEARCADYQPTARVLQHIEDELDKHALVRNEAGEQQKVHVSLLSGADLVETMSAPGVWAQEDLDVILGHFGLFCVERAGTDIDAAMGPLEKYRDNIRVIAPLIQNDVSSTKIRLFLKKSLSIRYLVPPEVIAYIEQHKLYIDDIPAMNNPQEVDAEKGKSAADGITASSS